VGDFETARTGTWRAAALRSAVSLGVERIAGRLRLGAATSWSSAARMAASAASAPRWSGSKLIVFGDRAVDGV